MFKQLLCFALLASVFVMVVPAPSVEYLGYDAMLELAAPPSKCDWLAHHYNVTHLILERLKQKLEAEQCEVPNLDLII